MRFEKGGTKLGGADEHTGMEIKDRDPSISTRKNATIFIVLW